MKFHRKIGGWHIENRAGPRAAQREMLAVVIMAAAWPVVPGCGVLQVPREAIGAVEEWSERTGEVDPCRVNAMQHCVAASATAAVCGAPCAVALGRLLEIAQNDGDPMDFHNNAAGAECAAPIDGDDSGAVACCEQLLNAVPSGLSLSGSCR